MGRRSEIVLPHKSSDHLVLLGSCRMHARFEIVGVYCRSATSKAGRGYGHVSRVDNLLMGCVWVRSSRELDRWKSAPSIHIMDC